MVVGLVSADDQRMKLAAVLVAVALAGAGSSLASGKGPTGAPPVGCARFDVKGTVTALGRSTFTLAVPNPKQQGANGGPSTLVVKIEPATQVFWTGTGTLAGPAVGEHAWAKGR